MSAEAEAAENNIYLMFPLSATATTTTTAKQLGNVCASLESKCTQTKAKGAGGVQFSRICLGMQ